MSDGAGTQLGLEAITLGQFAEQFLREDNSNWFRRMKLLDHIEAVQDKVQGWLDLIEQSLEGERLGFRGQGSEVEVDLSSSQDFISFLSCPLL